MAYSEVSITPTTAAKLIAEQWTRDIEKPFYKALYFQEAVTKRTELASGGNKLNIPFLTNSYNARDKVAGTPIVYDANVETEIELTINKHKYLAFILEEITRIQSNYNLQEMYRGVQKEAIARAIDTDLGALHASAGTNIAGGATVDDADILAVIAALDLADVPQTGRVGIVHSKVAGDLRAVNKYSAYDQTGKTGLAASGEQNIAQVYNMDLFMSNNVAVDTVSHNLFFHKSAVSLALQLKPTYKMEESVDVIGLKSVLHTIYGVAVERAAALVDLERTA
jgi:hypothetical protein